MAPQKRVWTFNDVTNNRVLSRRDGDTKGPSVTTNPLSAPYCQPATSQSSHSGTFELHAIPDLPLADVCRQTLERVQKEFEPIIRRRGYNVLSVSELCCCGDGLDSKSRRKRRRQPDNVLGYNQTRFLGRGRTSHTIHLRLRNPRNHDSALLSWEDVAGTMAHELSHCVHQNHGQQFYKLMEEILEEHATNQVNSMGGLIYGHSNVASQPSSTSSAVADTSGKRLGGKKGKSRLLDGNQGVGGRALGGRTMLPSDRRAAMVHAAETRRRQMEQTKRLIARSKEPCVIELLGDEDDDVPESTSSVSSSHAITVGKSATTLSTDRKRPKVSADTIDLTGEVLASGHSPLDASDVWACPRCTFVNKPLALVCDMCLSERTT